MPRIVRLVRSVVLSAREEPYVEAAIALGTPHAENHVAASDAEYARAADRAGHLYLRLGDPDRGDPVFLGAGLGTETPSWGNVMSEGRIYFQIKPSLIFWPGLMLSLCILSINLLGDAARDMLDPRLTADQPMSGNTSAETAEYRGNRRNTAEP